MVGTTLVALHEHIEALASADGEYCVVCGRTGDRPVPISGLCFDERATARSAARAAEQYRTALRRYDPQVPYYDRIVCRDAGRVHSAQRVQQGLPETDPQTLVPYLYQGFPVDRPLLVTIARLDDACAECQRAVRQHLIRRA